MDENSLELQLEKAAAQIKQLQSENSQLRSDLVALRNQPAMQHHTAGKEALGPVAADSLAQVALDSLHSHIAITDRHGNVIAANRSWLESSTQRATLPPEMAATMANSLFSCLGCTSVCAESESAIEGLRSVLEKRTPRFELEYPCRYAGGEKWFLMSVTPLERADGGAVIAHLDVTERRKVELALHRSESRLSTVLHSIHEVVWRSSPGSYASSFISPAFERVWGFSTGDALRNPQLLMESIHPDDRELFLDKLEQQAAGQCTTCEFRIRRPDGITRWIWDRAVPEMDENGQVLEINGIAADVTERKNSEAEIRKLFNVVEQSEEQLRRLSDNLPGGFVYQMVKGQDSFSRFVYISAGVERIFGLKPQEVIENPGLLYGLVLPEDVHFLAEAEMRSHLNLTPFSCEIRSRKPDGSMVWMSLNSAPRSSGDGNVIWDGFAFDITEKKNAEQDATIQRLKVTGIIDSAMDGIITIDHNHRIVVFNAAAEKMFGCSSASVLGASIDRFIPSRHRQSHSEHVRIFGETGRTTRPMGRMGEVYGVRSNGEDFPLEAAISQLELVGQKLFTITCRDVTERRQAEHEKERLEKQLRQVQKLEALGTLAGGIAHDFNNVLGAILGNIHLACLDVHPDHPAYESLSESSKAGERAKRLVQQILAFSRQQPQERHPINLEPVVKEAASLLRATLPAGIDLFKNISPNTPNILADASQIHQILLNLCTNAWHAMEGLQGRIEIKLDEAEAGESGPSFIAGLRAGRCTRLSVSDNGHGMDAATLERIFEPFFTTKGPDKGTGLGLAVVHGIVRAHEGAIAVKSEPGVGTTFEIYFPAIKGTASSSTENRVKAPPGAQQHILCIDDEEPLVRLAARMLQRLGYKASCYSKPAEALAVFRASPESFDLVITDLNMPGSSGLEIVEQLRQIRPKIRVILNSGHLTDDYMEKAKALEISHVLRKPASLEDLGETVHQALASP